MKKGISLLVLFCVAITSACKYGKTLTPDLYVQYLENPRNQFVSTQVFGSKEYTIQFATAEYIACKEIEHSDSSSKLIKRINELKGYVFFLIKVGTTEKSRLEQGGNRISEQQVTVNEMVTYYDQKAASDITLSYNKKELKPATYHFENNYELTPYNTIIVGFEIKEQYSDLKLTFNDEYNDIPSIHAFFDHKKLASLPQLKL